MADKFYEGIEIGLKPSEYTEQELAILPPLPKAEKGVDYPDYYDEPPFVWTGTRWTLCFE